MKRFRKVVCWGLCLLLAVPTLLLSWVVYTSRPVCREDRFPAEQAAGQTGTGAPTSLKVLTWNVQMLPSLLGGWVAKLDKMQQLRAEWIVDHLKQLDYDVVCLQEAFDPQCVKRLVDGLSPEYPYVVLPRHSGRIWQQSNGVLFLSRVPVKHVAHVVFPTGEGIERFAAKGVTLVEGIKEGFTFQVAGTHFQTGRDRFKEADIRTAARDLLKAQRRDRVPLFFVGDFNIRKGSPQYAMLLAETGMLDFPIDDPRPYTSDSNNSWKRGREKMAHIDHVLLDPRGTKTTVVRQRIQRATHDHHGETIDLADHYGVIAEATLEN